MCENQPIIFEPGAPDFSGPAGIQTKADNPDAITTVSPIIVIDRLTGLPISDRPNRDDSDAGIESDLDETINKQRAEEIAALGYPLTPV